MGKRTRRARCACREAIRLGERSELRSSRKAPRECREYAEIFTVHFGRVERVDRVEKRRAKPPVTRKQAFYKDFAGAVPNRFLP